MTLFDTHLGAFRCLGATELKLGTVSYWRNIVVVNELEEFPLRDGFLNCGGVSLDAEMSLLKAKAEAFERYSMSLVSHPTKRTREPLGFMKLQEQLDSVWLHNAPSIEEVKEDIHWVTLPDLVTGELVDVPEQLFNFKITSREFSYQFIQVSSNGFSAHTDLEKAYYNGIMENVERDAVLRAWLTLDGISKLPDACVSADDAEVLMYLKEQGWKVCVNAIENEFGVPTVWIFGYHPDVEAGRVKFGAKSALDFQDATKGALSEFLASYAIPQQAFHMEEFTNENLHAFYEFLTIQPMATGYENLPVSWRTKELASHVRSIRHTYCLGAIFTLPEVEAEGFHVVRVIVPGCMYFSDTLPVEGVHLFKNSRKTNLFQIDYPRSLYI